MIYTVILSIGPAWLATSHNADNHLLGLMLGWKVRCLKIEVGYWRRIGIHVSGLDIERKERESSQ